MNTQEFIDTARTLVASDKDLLSKDFGPHFKGAERFRRRLAKVAALEREKKS